MDRPGYYQRSQLFHRNHEHAPQKQDPFQELRNTMRYLFEMLRQRHWNQSRVFALQICFTFFGITQLIRI